MECPYCGVELCYEDEWGIGRYGNPNWKIGEIYVCPHRDGFETKEEVMEYLELSTEEELSKYLKENDLSDWWEVACESGVFNGFFHTNRSGDLGEGYPC